MRELVINTGSTRAAIFNQICNNLEKNTLVQTLERYRQGGWTAVQLVKFMCCSTNQPAPKTAFGYLEYMAHGSPMLRGLCWEICHHMKESRQGKILVTEDSPLLAWWWELFLNMAQIRTRTFHASLSHGQRDQLIQEFNDPKATLQVMILPYDVGALGLNLQRDCSRVVVMSGAKNHGLETQAAMRPARVSL